MVGSTRGWSLYNRIPNLRLPQLIAQQPVDPAEGQGAGALSLPPSQTQAPGAGRQCRSPCPGLQEGRLLLPDSAKAVSLVA